MTVYKVRWTTTDQKKHVRTFYQRSHAQDFANPLDLTHGPVVLTEAKIELSEPHCDRYMGPN